MFARLVPSLLLGLASVPSCATAAFAKHEESLVKRVGVGVSAGATTGFGFSTRLRFSRGVALTLTGMPFFDPKFRGGSLGLQGSWDFLNFKGLSVYALLGSQVFISRVYYSEPFRGDKIRRRYDSLVVGPGVGMELRAGRFGFNFDLTVAGVFALKPTTHLRYAGRVNVGLFPNLAVCVYLGRDPR